MRQVILNLLLMVTVGVFAYGAGRNAQTTTGLEVSHLIETGQPHVVLAKSGTRQQKEALQQSEGCPVIPNGDHNQQKPDEQTSSLMKGLVF